MGKNSEDYNTNLEKSLQVNVYNLYRLCLIDKEEKQLNTQVLS